MKILDGKMPKRCCECNKWIHITGIEIGKEIYICFKCIKKLYKFYRGE